MDNCLRIKGLTTFELAVLLQRYPELEVRVPSADGIVPVSVVRIRDHYNPVSDKIDVYVEVF